RLPPRARRQALSKAGTIVCEPVESARLELPAARMGAVLSALSQLGASVETPQLNGDQAVIVTSLPSARVRSLREQLPGLTGGEGLVDSSFGGYHPVGGIVRLSLTIPSRNGKIRGQ